VELPKGVHTIHYGGTYHFEAGEFLDVPLDLPHDITMVITVGNTVGKKELGERAE